SAKAFRNVAAQLPAPNTATAPRLAAVLDEALHDAEQQYLAFCEARAAVTPPKAAVSAGMPREGLPHIGALTAAVRAELVKRGLDPHSARDLEEILRAAWPLVASPDGYVLHVGPVEIFIRFVARECVEVVRPPMHST